jgi:hypothetical protein
LILKYVQSKLGQVLQQRVNGLEVRFKRWTQPTRTSQVASTLTDLTRSKSELIAENMFLRQQLIVLERQVTRPRLKQRDRQILVILASRIWGWKEALMIVKPDTLVKWHQQGFKLLWRHKSQGRHGRSPIAAKTIVLIGEMAVNNRTWRAKRIQGELLKLGIKINLGTVKKTVRAGVYRPSNPGRTGPAILCKPMTCFSARSLCSSLSSWGRAAWCITESHGRRVISGSPSK